MPTILEASALPACITLAMSAAKALSAYRICVLDVAGAPSEFALEGSNTGIAWTELDWRTAEVFQAIECREFPVVSAVAYQYYRLRIMATPSGTALISSVELFERIANIVGHGEAESEAGCQDAIRLATIAAESDAASNLAAHCRAFFTATANRTKSCPNGLGTVTAIGSGASFESYADALKQAEDEAEAKSEAMLAQCATSNNTLPITIPDSGSGSPYPSVLNIEGRTGTITGITVAINGLSHGSAQDVHIILKSPTGTVVELMRKCGGFTSVGSGSQSGPVSPGINLVFSQAAADFLPENTTFAAGTYKPSQYGTTVPSPSPAPQPTYGASLEAFNLEDANGAWTLWVDDRLPEFRGAIYGGWSLSITTA